jgi:hypothetical protein
MPTLVFLTLVFCSDASGGGCAAVPGAAPYASEASCAAAAQPLAASWLANREPQWRLVGWTCGPDAGDGDDI